MKCNNLNHIDYEYLLESSDACSEIVIKSFHLEHEVKTSYL